MTDTAAGTRKKPKGRSPSYPAINLEAAIQRVQQLYREERQHLTPVTAIVRHWEYKSLNGPASLALAALKKFGLIEDEGVGSARQARVSDLAVEILDHPDEARRREAIRTAALKPAIHRELWEKYGKDLPSDVNLRWFLTRDRGFTETGAEEFIPEYRSTINFAQLPGAATIATQDEPEESGAPAHDDTQGGEGGKGDEQDRDGDKAEHGTRTMRNPRMTQAAEVNTYFVPIAAGLNVAVEGPFPLTEAQWAQFQAVLSAMKPALVSDDPGSQDEE